jgi:hypothetical protein
MGYLLRFRESIYNDTVVNLEKSITEGHNARMTSNYIESLYDMGLISDSHWKQYNNGELDLSVPYYLINCIYRGLYNHFDIDPN